MAYRLRSDVGPRGVSVVADQGHDDGGAWVRSDILALIGCRFTPTNTSAEIPRRRTTKRGRFIPRKDRS